ncbi:MAG: hypothetical protein Q7T28_03655 [Cypionkella sp.]|nr:hypothetical protein [Cypionkella sp.]
MRYPARQVGEEHVTAVVQLAGNRGEIWSPEPQRAADTLKCKQAAPNATKTSPVPSAVVKPRGMQPIWHRFCQDIAPRLAPPDCCKQHNWALAMQSHPDMQQPKTF